MARRFSIRWMGPVALVAASWLGCRSSPPEAAPGVLFREAAAETGLDFHHFIGASGAYYLPEIMTAGVAVLDYDGDGDLDVYYVQSAMLDPDREPEESIFPPPKEHWPGSRLYRNELVPGGELRFTDVTEEAGVGWSGYGVGASVGDYDSDGDPDLYVTSFGPNVLYRNNGDGSFTDVTGEAGVDDPRWSTSSTFFDYDRDGDLDLYVVNYVDFTVAANKDCYDSAGARDYCNPAVYSPVPDRLLRNEGGGRFVDVTAAAGIGTAVGSGLGVTAADINDDSWMDIVVTNDGNANHLWENQGDGTFVETGLMSGIAFNMHGQPEASMGVTLGDYDSDGDEDIFMAHLTRETNTLYLNEGGYFEDATDRTGLGSPSFAFTGFGSQWFDYDHDGWQDLFIVNGAVTILEEQRGTPFPFRQKTMLYRNLGDGRLREMSGSGGPAFELTEASRGAAFGDIDNDGDIDVAIANGNGPAHLFLNEAGSPRPWLMVELKGKGGNREAIGARLAVLRRGRAPLWRRVHRDGSYTSSNDVRVHFGLGDGADLEGVGVIWPGGQREFWDDVTPNGVVRLAQGTGKPWAGE